MLPEYTFLVLEGVEGSGKATIGKALSEKLSSEFFQTPAGFWCKHRGMVEHCRLAFRFAFYLLAAFHTSFLISRMLKKKPVVCDRYIHSTWAHHTVYGCRFLKHISPGMLPIKIPDRIYYLYASREVRENRISDRKGNTDKDWDSDTLGQVHGTFMTFKEITLIDSTDLTRDQVVNKIIEDLKNCGLAITNVLHPGAPREMPTVPG